MFKRKAPAWLRAGRFAVGTALVAGLATSSGCLERELGPVGPRSTAFINEKLTQSKVDKIDLILGIDNSRSMADKQEILALAIPDLVKGLVNPGCYNVESGVFVETPAGPLDECPAGTKRDFDPVLDIHIGVVTSSLGGHGSDACNAATAGKESNNDKGQLIARVDAAGTAPVETYQSQKFLAWDPSQKLTPPGEGDLDVDGGDVNNMTALLPQLRSLVIGAGQIGCGYEAQLESWYRFLVDPTPPNKVTLDGSKNVLLEGVDETLLAQRKNFLRPDSLLAVVILTDENDCSIKESKQFYYAAQQKGSNNGPFHLPKARPECATDPNNECCFSCGQKGPTDSEGNPTCPPAESCKNASGDPVYHDDLTDNINLRCWDQKRRFGIDFLYPVSRYVDALKQQTITDRSGQVVPNPVFSDLDQSDDNNTIRTSNLIFVAGIVGVPWQDIARTNANGTPDLNAGLDFENNPRGGFKNTDEMSQLLPGKDYTTWDLILGDTTKYPEASSLPKDPLMIEHYAPRSGSNPITGDPVVTAATPLGNKINGHEWSIEGQDDLQYACIFPLVQVDPVTGNISDLVRDCSVAGLASCDCEDENNDNPLCQVNPATGKPTNQVAAKAYPGIRELQFLKNIGSQGIVGSVCPAQLKNKDGNDFGYRPAIGAIIDRLKQALRGQCLSRGLNVSPEGKVLCLVIEAAKTDECNCNVPGRNEISEENASAKDKIIEDNKDSDFNCFCEITQLVNESGEKTQEECEDNFDQEGNALCACQWTPPDQPVLSGGEEVDGWCYVDGAAQVGNPALVDNCPDTEPRIIRFVGDGQAKPGTTLFITCAGDAASN